MKDSNTHTLPRSVKCYYSGLIPLIKSFDSIGEIGVYKISNSIDDRVYIGSTVSKSTHKTKGFLRRWRQHYSGLICGVHHSKHLQNFVNKYGVDTLLFEIVEISTKLQTSKREQYWLDFYDSYKNGFNQSGKVTSSKSGKEHFRYIDIDKEAINLYTTGLSIKEVSSKLNVSTTKVSSVLEDACVSIDNHRVNYPFTEIFYRWKLGGETLNSLATEYNTSPSVFYRNFKRLGFPSSDDILLTYAKRYKDFRNNNGVRCKGGIVAFFSKIPVHFSAYYRLNQKGLL